MDVQQRMTSADLDRQYQRTVLKVPDCFAIEKDALTKEMLNTNRELFKVWLFETVPNIFFLILHNLWIVSM